MCLCVCVCVCVFVCLFLYSDVYEPAFQQGRGDWQAQRDEGRGFFVEVTLTDKENTDDLFYFCHIHGGMSGRIVVLDEDGNAVNPSPGTPALPYGRETPSDFDTKCGTYGTGDFQRGSKLCPANDYVFCDDDSEPSEFSECMFALVRPNNPRTHFSFVLAT